MGTTDREKTNKAPRAVTKGLSNVVLAIVTAVLLSLLVALLTYFDRAEEIVAENEQNYIRLDKVDALLIQLLNIESGARGYILSQDKAFLESFVTGIDRVQAVLASAKQEWQGHIAKDGIRSLETEINQMIVKLDDLIRETDGPELERTRQFNQTKRLMDDLRQKLTTIRGNIVTRTKFHHSNNLIQFNRIKWIILSLSAIAFSLLIMVFALAQKQQRLAARASESLALRNDRLEDLVSKRTNELVDLASYLTRSNEDEKRRIARELHDELGALLTAARMDTSWAIRNLDSIGLDLQDDEQFRTRLSRLSDTLSKGIALKRQITSSLVPPLLRELGLVEAIRAMLEEAEDADQTDYKLHVDNSLPDIDPDRQLALFRICQESLTNAKKYAKASKVEVSLNYIEKAVSPIEAINKKPTNNKNPTDTSSTESQLQIQIRDNGRGFDSAAGPQGTHGLAGMRSRAAMFKGTFEVSSQPGEGTLITAKLPLSAVTAGVTAV